LGRLYCRMAVSIIVRLKEDLGFGGKKIKVMVSSAL
jgi:hypothetical protein